ncbi:MAG: protein kinase, partial [Planctomycetes bacterium]|nr:protein kinase [Planctomycetota bacterium]
MTRKCSLCAKELAEDQEDLCAECQSSCETLASEGPSSRAEADPQRADSASPPQPDRAKPVEHYKVHGRVGRGSMGEVFYAEDSILKRPVALKRLSRQTKGNTAYLRFLNEARITGSLDHPNIVPVYELREKEGQAFYTMKFVRGVTLRSLLQQLKNKQPQVVEKYSLAHLLEIFSSCTQALAYAHAKGVIHRDLKPENIMIGNYGEVQVMDWGLAKRLDEAESEETGGSQTLDDPGLTMGGAILGTPGYMSPEQARGESDRIDTRSDIFALGAILYHILTLKMPYEGNSLKEVLAKAAQRDLQPIEQVVPRGNGLPHLPRGRVPPVLAAIAMKAMARDPEARYQKVEELQADISAYRNKHLASVEKPSPLRRFLLLLKRRKRESTISLAALLFTLALSIFFTTLLRQVGQNYNQERSARQELMEKNAAELKREWRLDFQDDFERKEPGPDWKALEGQALIEDGELLLQGYFSQYLLLDRAFPGDIRVEFDFRQEGTLLGEIGCELGSSGTPDSGFSFIGCKSLNRTSQIVSSNNTKSLAEGGGFEPESGRRYHFAAEKRGGRFRLEIDGKPFLEYDSPLYPMPLQGSFFALKGNYFPRWIDGLRLYRLQAPKKLTLQDLAYELVDQQNFSLAGKYFRLLLAGEKDGNARLQLTYPLCDILAKTQRYEEGCQLLMGMVSIPESVRPFVSEEIPSHRRFTMLLALLCRDLLAQSLTHQRNEELLEMLILWTREAGGEAVLGDVLGGIDFEHLDLRELGLGLVKRTEDLDFLKRTRLNNLFVKNFSLPDLSSLNGTSLEVLVLSSATSLRSFRGLEGSPLRKLSIISSPVSDLEALRGLPLESLTLNFCPQVKDLSPLAEAPLKQLLIRGTGVCNISVLRGKPLEFLALDNLPIEDFSPLKEMPLIFLNLWGTRFSDLSILSGKKLLSLILTDSAVTDLSPLSHFENLKLLYLAGTKIKDLSPLATLKLVELDLRRCPVEDLAPLAGMPLATLALSECPASDLRPLRGTAINTLLLENTKVADLSPLAGSPLRGLYLGNTLVEDLAPLIGLPLVNLRLSHTRVMSIEALAGLPLKSLNLASTRVRDISALEDLPLIELDLSGTAVENIWPLRGLDKLEKLSLKGTAVADISPL